MSGNQLVQIDKNIFRGLINLNKIALTNNLLTRLDKTMFTGLTNLDSIYLHNNNFSSNKFELILESSVKIVAIKNLFLNEISLFKTV